MSSDTKFCCSGNEIPIASRINLWGRKKSTIRYFLRRGHAILLPYRHLFSLLALALLALALAFLALVNENAAQIIELLPHASPVSFSLLLVCLDYFDKIAGDTSASACLII